LRHAEHGQAIARGIFNQLELSPGREKSSRGSIEITAREPRPRYAQQAFGGNERLLLRLSLVVRLGVTRLGPREVSCRETVLPLDEGSQRTGLEGQYGCIDEMPGRFEMGEGIIQPSGRYGYARPANGRRRLYPRAYRRRKLLFREGLGRAVALFRLGVPALQLESHAAADFDVLHEAGVAAIFPPGPAIPEAAARLNEELNDRLRYRQKDVAE